MMDSEERSLDSGVGKVDPLVTSQVSGPGCAGVGLRAIRTHDKVSTRLRLQRAAGRSLVKEPVVVVELEHGHAGVGGIDLPKHFPFVVVGTGADRLFEWTFVDRCGRCRGLAGVEHIFGVDHVGDAAVVSARFFHIVFVADPVMVVIVEEAGKAGALFVINIASSVCLELVALLTLIEEVAANDLVGKDGQRKPFAHFVKIDVVGARGAGRCSALQQKDERTGGIEDGCYGERMVASVRGRATENHGVRPTGRKT